MKRKLILCLFTLLMLFAFSSVGMADSLQNGDEVYIVKTIGDVGGGIFMVKDLAHQPLFETFCLETNEGLQGAPFTVHIDTYAIAGGAGGVVEVSPGVFGDPISIATAFLYANFRSGTIPGFDKTILGDVDALQFAFWILEEEISLAQVNPALYPWYPKMIDYLAFSESSDWTDIGPVRVLNLSHTVLDDGFSIEQLDGGIIQNQSMLTMVPEPMSLLLLGLGLLGIGFTRKRLTH